MGKNNGYFEELKKYFFEQMGPTDQQAFDNPTLQSLADIYTQKRMLYAYNCDRPEMSNGDRMICECFLAGKLTRILLEHSYTGDDLYFVGRIENILNINMGHDMDELLQTTMSALAVGGFGELKEKQKVLLRPCLTHQLDISKNSVQTVLTILYTTFLMGAAVELR
jgi:hypothetical protein